MGFWPIWLAFYISSSSFWAEDTYFWSYFSWLAKSGCQNLKLAGNTFPPFPSFWSPGYKQQLGRKWTLGNKPLLVNSLIASSSIKKVGCCHTDEPTSPHIQNSFIAEHFTSSVHLFGYLERWARDWSGPCLLMKLKALCQGRCVSCRYLSFVALC